MDGRFSRGVMAALLLCAALSAYYLRAQRAERVSAIPVERVFARVSATQALGYRQQRDQQRAQELAALTALAETDDTAKRALEALISRMEDERAVEGALAALGSGEAVCVCRAEEAVLYVREALESDRAQAVIELCARITGFEPENVFILDGCAYL